MATRSVTVGKVAHVEPGELAGFDIDGTRVAVAYEPVHWFWSDQYDFNLQYAGLHQRGDRLVIRGSLDSRHFLAFYVSDHRISAVAALNRGKDLRRAMPLIKARATVDAAELEDEGVDLRSLLHAHIGGDQGGVTT